MHDGCNGMVLWYQVWIHKLQFRSSPCTFLGYNTTHKGYVCLSQEDRIYISRNVKFNELVFPYHNKSNHSVLPTPTSKHVSLYLPQSIPSPTPPIVNSPPSQGLARICSSVPTTSSSFPSLEENTNTGYVPMNQHPMVSRAKVGTFKPKVLLSSSSLPQEPLILKEAQASKDWCQAMDSELRALQENHTWSLIEAPPNTPVIGCKWVFKLKTNLDGTIARHKARLVAKDTLKLHAWTTPRHLVLL